MSWKQTAQYSFADALLIEHKSLSKLDDVHEIIDWKQIEKTLSHLYASKRGVPAYPPLMMFKILILQAWYNLSDEALEEQIARDLMFRRFIGLSLSDAVPDHSTIWRFRNLLHTENLLDSLLVQINNHLAKNSLIVATGSVNIIDATVIEAKQCRSKKNKQGDNTQDPEAAWNVKTASDGRRKSTYGFKMHANTDEDGFIKKMTYTPGNVHDSLHDFGEFEHLLGDRHGQVYADSAYANKDNDQKLGKENNRILHRAYRNTPLTEQQKALNKMYSSVRYVVEHTFGLLKLHHGLGKARYMGLARNKTRAHLIAMSHNLKTGMNIFKELQRLKESCA